MNADRPDASPASRRRDAPLVLLGPQRLRPTLRSVFADLGVRGRVAVVTAGWEERESDTTELAEHLGLPVVHLELFRRTEEIFAADPALLTTLRERQDQFRALQRLYRGRLGHGIAAARELLDQDEDPELIAQQFDAAMRAIRTLDREHLETVTRVQAAYEPLLDVDSRPAVVAQRREIRAVLDGADALAIAGGHVAILLNRLRLYDVIGAAGDRPIVAWSAGAMALGERIVLFHDKPPQGAGNAEVLRAGLGCYDGILPLPHAKRRLELGDPVRVSLFARRFAPDRCVAFDDGARLDHTERGWVPHEGLTRLSTSGEVAGDITL